MFLQQSSRYSSLEIGKLIGKFIGKYYSLYRDYTEVTIKTCTTEAICRYLKLSLTLGSKFFTHKGTATKKNSPLLLQTDALFEFVKRQHEISVKDK